MPGMTDDRLTLEQIAAARERRLFFQHALEIEGNPLTPEEIAIFEMFEREGWSHERCRAYIMETFGSDKRK
jgi:hypothetical protein